MEPGGGTMGISPGESRVKIQLVNAVDQNETLS